MFFILSNLPSLISASELLLEVSFYSFSGGKAAQRGRKGYRKLCGVVTGELPGVSLCTGAARLLLTGRWAGDVLPVPSLWTAASIMEDRALLQHCWGNIVFFRFPPTQRDKMEGL